MSFLPSLIPSLPPSLPPFLTLERAHRLADQLGGPGQLLIEDLLLGHRLGTEGLLGGKGREGGREVVRFLALLGLWPPKLTSLSSTRWTTLLSYLATCTRADQWRCRLRSSSLSHPLPPSLPPSLPRVLSLACWTYFERRTQHTRCLACVLFSKKCVGV